MGIEGGSPETSGFWQGLGQRPNVSPRFSHSQKQLFHFWRFHSGTRIFFWGFEAPKTKTQKTFGGFGVRPARRSVLGFSSASPQVVHKLFHTSVDIVDNLWTGVDNSGISPIFPVFAGFFIFPQKSLMRASIRRFPRGRPRPAARPPNRRYPCRSQTSEPGRSAR